MSQTFESQVLSETIAYARYRISNGKTGVLGTRCIGSIHNEAIIHSATGTTAEVNLIATASGEFWRREGDGLVRFRGREGQHIIPFTGLNMH